MTTLKRCRDDGRCQQAIEFGAEGLGSCSPVCVMPREGVKPVAEVYRYGKDSHGREWHGVHWYDPNLNVPAGTKLYLEEPATPTWRPLTRQLLNEISQESDTTYWLAIPGVGKPLVGVYEWRQGHNPDGFNTQGDGRIRASDVSHVMLFVEPALPGAT